MKIKRLFQTLGLISCKGARARGRFLREKKIFYSVGENVSYQPRIIPLYPELIRLHNNIMIGAGVRFVTHDMAHTVLNRMEIGEFKETIGCIEIMDNVFIGYNTIVLPNVLIGDNVIIGAGSVVAKDLPSNGVYAGVPARRLQDFESFIEKRRPPVNKEKSIPSVNNNQRIEKAEIEAAWDYFNKIKGEGND